MEGGSYKGSGRGKPYSKPFGDKPKKPICNDFVSEKGCNRGTNCNYYHPKNITKGGPGGIPGGYAGGYAPQ